MTQAEEQPDPVETPKKPKGSWEMFKLQAGLLFCVAMLLFIFGSGHLWLLPWAVWAWMQEGNLLLAAWLALRGGFLYVTTLLFIVATCKATYTLACKYWSVK